MPKPRAGWERKIYIGTAGSTAATLLNKGVTDVDIQKTPDKEETTDRGDGSAVPRKHYQVVARDCEVKWKQRYWDGDANLNTVLAAAEAGTGLAIKVERIASGEVEFDGDCIVEMNSPGPLSGGMEIEFTAVPTQDYGRQWAD